MATTELLLGPPTQKELDEARSLSELLLAGKLGRGQLARHVSTMVRGVTAPPADDGEAPATQGATVHKIRPDKG